jgi:mannitol/fructose-specific phosphotransferase system IIA component (Ntr-type)
MKSLLSALQEGRLVELPDPDKDRALEYLALLIEAIPDEHNQSDVVKEVLQREAIASTALGKGIACPHARKSGEGDLLCSVGWSPQGIDYGAPDGQKVHLVIMYYIPDSQRNSYLKEISGLAKAALKTDGITTIASAGDIHSVRSQLLDWVGYAIDSAIPDAKARMIKLQEKQAAITAVPGKEFRPFSIVPFFVVVTDAARPMVLASDAEFVKIMESQTAIADLLKKNETFECAGYQIIVRSMSSYAGSRIMHDCLAVKPSELIIANGAGKAGK